MSDAKQVDFSLSFVTKQKEVDALAKAIGRKAAGDAIVWIAYPKKSSKKYTCEFNRDSGWPSMGEAGFEPVRMVAIDEDWSALRFRRAEFIKNDDATRRVSVFRAREEGDRQPRRHEEHEDHEENKVVFSVVFVSFVNFVVKK